jgi:hypothetical protein
MMDSNHRIPESKSGALPLGESPTEPYKNTLQIAVALRVRSLAKAMCFYMVGAVRLELTTYRLKADYSNQLSYAPISCHSCHSPCGLSLKIFI